MARSPITVDLECLETLKMELSSGCRANFAYLRYFLIFRGVWKVSGTTSGVFEGRLEGPHGYRGSALKAPIAMGILCAILGLTGRRGPT